MLDLTFQSKYLHLLFVNLQSLSLGRTKSICLVRKVLGPFFEKSLCEDIAGMPFSLMIDESTDISTSKLLATSIRYFSISKQRVITTFLEVKEVERVDAQGLFEAVEETLKKWNLEPNNFVALSSDGASVMMGSHNSVWALLKKKYPWLLHLRCTCHSLDLAAKDAQKKALPSHLETMLRESYNWFSRSSSRLSSLNQISSLLDVEYGADEETSASGTMTYWYPYVL